MKIPSSSYSNKSNAFVWTRTRVGDHKEAFQVLDIMSTRDGSSANEQFHFKKNPFRGATQYATMDQVLICDNLA
ncbi:hypothetical protein L2E82_15062 [Cichorium intybus]|uniref:Uncharacterized protein n=1 Tax=Cichorium intybus TaxID=13427 RepID=A0ACB9F2X6_CICIN|nr:hypothetical protein L2E82_15062 [Cichorium intybus]